jgi:hypothetical protein
MADGAAVDTDVLLKAAAYRLATELVAILEPRGRPATLGLTHLIAHKQLARHGHVTDVHGAEAELRCLLAMLGRLEPTDDEVTLAAELAATAQQRSLSLDVGEAQLIAIVISRRLPLMVTGDKRALVALGGLLTRTHERAALIGRLACFEQVVSSIAAVIGEHELRSRVCAEPALDIVMRLACSCGREGWNSVEFHEACISYVRAVRTDVGDLLMPGLTLA